MIQQQEGTGDPVPFTVTKENLILGPEKIIIALVLFY